VSNISQQEIKKKLVEQMLEDFKKSYNSKNLQDLRQNSWKTLQNSESWNAETMIKIEKNLKNAEDKKKIYQCIFDIVADKTVDAPIIMVQNNVGMLISGEHMLMACRLLNIQPKVVMF
jgi:glutamyl-tRNA reductase